VKAPTDAPSGESVQALALELNAVVEKWAAAQPPGVATGATIAVVAGGVVACWAVRDPAATIEGARNVMLHGFDTMVEISRGDAPTPLAAKQRR
jgi:hypothetical protein